MGIKVINTRITNRFDTLANWQADGVELLAGEIALVKVETQQIDENGNIVNVPAILMKVGDVDEEGNPKAFKNLPWLSGKAADVFGWAKKQYAKDIPVEVITGTDDEGQDIISEKSLGEWLAELNANTSAKVDVEDVVNNAIAAAIEALGFEESGEGNFVKAVTLADGKVTITKTTIAKEDLPELSATDIIFAPASDSSDAITVADKFDAIDSELESIKRAVASGIRFVGIVKDPEDITQNLEANEVVLSDDSQHTAVAGDIIVQGQKEFIWDGTSWKEFGDLSHVGNIELAIQNIEAKFAGMAEATVAEEIAKAIEGLKIDNVVIPEASTEIPGIVKLGAEGGAATYEAVEEVTTRVDTIEENYTRIGTKDGKSYLYSGKEDKDIVIFACGSAAGI